jgi:hypothetical protein
LELNIFSFGVVAFLAASILSYKDIDLGLTTFE